jgi:hypothetical protein
LKNFWVIESANRQGNHWRKITVTPRKEMTAVVPWRPELIKRYDQMLYSDFWIELQPCAQCA